MILDVYFARRFIQSFLVILAVFVALVALVDLIEQLRRFEGLELSLWQLFGMTALNLPGAINELLPLVTILGTVALFVGLARSSELVVARAVGRSGIRVVIAPVVLAMLMGALAVSVLNPLVAATSNRYNQLSEFYRTGNSSAVSISGEGLWLRQGDGDSQSVIQARQFDPHTNMLLNVTLVKFGADARPSQRIRAATARLSDGEWVMTQAKEWDLQDSLNPEADAVIHPTLRLPTSLTDERLRESLGSSSSVSIYDLPQVIRDLRQAGFESRYYEVWLQAELARPLFLAAMVLVGSVFTMRHVRFGGTGVAALASVLLGFSFYFIRNFAQILGEHGQIPVALAVWAPPIASILLTMGLLLQAEDG